MSKMLLQCRFFFYLLCCCWHFCRELQISQVSIKLLLKSISTFLQNISILFTKMMWRMTSKTHVFHRNKIARILLILLSNRNKYMTLLTIISYFLMYKFNSFSADYCNFCHMKLLSHHSFQDWECSHCDWQICSFKLYSYLQWMCSATYTHWWSYKEFKAECRYSRWHWWVSESEISWYKAVFIFWDTCWMHLQWACNQIWEFWWFKL